MDFRDEVTSKMKCAKNNEIRGNNRPITRTGVSGHRYIRYGQRVPGNSITIFASIMT